MNWKEFWGCGHGLIQVLSWHLPGVTEEKHESFKISGILAEIPPMYNLFSLWFGVCLVL
jgi:hypothetical protein